jgi:hypothetical protein
MKVSRRRDGCLTVFGECGDADEIVVAPVITNFTPTSESVLCCNARLECRPIDNGAELICPRCHYVHARFALGVRVHR